MVLDNPGWEGIVLGKAKKNAAGEWTVAIGEKDSKFIIFAVSQKDLSEFKQMEAVSVTGVVTQIEKNGTFQVMNAELKLDGGR